jgi:hypothetical protein
VTPRIASLLTVVVAAACTAEPPAEPLSAAESEVMTSAVSDTVEMVSLVGSTNIAVTALTHRLIPCATVDSDNRTFVTVTYACTRPFAIEGTIHFEKSTPEQLITVSDLLVNKVSIDSATTLVVPTDPTARRTFDGALVVVGPTRELDAVVSASWVVSGRCMVLDAAGFVLLNSVEHAFTITGKRICRRF